MKDLLGPVPDHTSGTFRLDKREAVLIVGLLPPPARYFGLQTYVFTRKGSLDPEDPVFQATLVDPVMHNILFSRAPDPSRVLTFSSIGNSNNNAVIERKSGAAFNRQRSFVISTDAGMAREMTEALVHARIATPSQVFGEPVSDQVARLGLDAGADDFMTLIRYAQPAARVSNFQSLQTSIDLIGQHCLLRPMNCLGNTQDADYQISPSLTLDDGKVIAVAGALGTATGNATYVGLSVNWLAVLKGVANLSDEDMQGTADGFSRTVRHTGKLYLRYFARDCSGIPSCQQITEAMVPRGDVLKDHPAQLRGPGHLARGGPAKVAQSGGDHP
jgi:hypothetical protein